MTEVPTNAIVRGDVYRTLASWPDGMADFAVADPAYGMGKADWDQAADYDFAWIREARRVLKPTGTLYIFGRPEVVATNWESFPSPKRLLTWAATNRVVPSVKTWQPTAEAIVMCWKGAAPFFDRDIVREPYSESAKRQRGRRRPPTPGRFGKKASTYSIAEGALPRDVIRGPGLTGRTGAREGLDHPCQKPLWLLDRLIKASCPPSGVVLDLFSGTATASAAAHNLGRKWIAVENDAHWCEVALKRLREAGATDATIWAPPSPKLPAELLAWKDAVDAELARLQATVAALAKGSS